jgi:TolA-binding protein
MVEGEHSQALLDFLRLEKEYPETDLYFDTLFKLGTVYYMLENYDSSATYFNMVTSAEKASLVENAYFNLGLALEEAGLAREASRAFLSLAVRFPFSERFERALLRAAYTLEQAGWPVEAIPIYRALLQYAEDPETAAETMYWIGESYSEADDPLRAACEFLRVVHLFEGGGPWVGTAGFRAGMECEKAGLTDHALIVYRENVRKFGTDTDWGRASQERLDELTKPAPEGKEMRELVPGEAGAQPGSPEEPQ